LKQNPNNGSFVEKNGVHFIQVNYIIIMGANITSYICMLVLKNNIN
jgi:hypothetical protein